MLPPVFHQGQVLVDGAVINNLPTDVMREQAVGDVIAVDIGADDVLHAEVEEYASPHGWQLLLDKLRPWLVGESAHGDQAAAAEALGMNAGAMKAAVHRMRHRFRQCVKNEVAGTLKDASAVDEEMQALLAALGG